MDADDPYVSAGATAPPISTSTDPYAIAGAVEAPETSKDPYEASGAVAIPPLSEDDFQTKLKNRWGPILAGQSMGAPTDWAEMEASGKISPQQIQSAQTETSLRQTYIDQQSHPFANLASGAENLAKSVAVVPRVLEAYNDISANPGGYANDAGRVASGVTEGFSDAVTGIGGMLAAPFQYLGHRIAPGPTLTPEQQYQKWKMDYVAQNPTPGYTAHTTSRVQDALEAITGDSAESFAKPAAGVTELASTAASLPAFEGAAGLVGAGASKGLAAVGLPNLAKAVAPVTGASGAAKLQDAMTAALKGGAEATAPTAASTIMAGTGKAISATSKAASTIAAAPENLSKWLTEKVTGSPALADQLGKYVDASGWMAAPLATALGSPAMGAAIGAVKVLEKGGAIGQGLGDFMTRVAQASPTDPLGRFMALAADKEAPNWMRQVAQSPAVQFAVKAGNLAGSTLKGVAKGAATGAALSTISGDNPEATLESALNFGAFGALHGAMSAREASIFNANLGAVGKFVGDHIDSGGSPDTLKLVPADQILQASLWSSINPDWKIRFATDADASSPFSKGQGAEGQAGLYDRNNKTLWIDPTKRAPNATLTHEAMHPIFDNLVSQQGGIKDTLDHALAADNRSIDDFKQQYANRVFPTDPQQAADYIKSQDEANPNWAYSELLSDSAAHELSGKDLLEAARGNAVQQSATQAALGGMQGWLSAEGVKFQEHANGTIFPDFKNVFTNPEVRKLAYKLVKSQRDITTGNASPEDVGRPLTKADMGSKAAPFYKTPEGEKVNPYGQMVPNGKGGERFVAWPGSELKKRGALEAAARQKYFPAGKIATSMPAGLEADPNIAPWTKTALRAIFDSVQNKNKLATWYHRLNSENSATSDKGWAADTKRTLGNARVSYQSGKPLGVELTKKGNLITRWESEEAENQKLADWAQRHGDLSLDLWGGDQAKAKADIQTYLANHAAGQPGESNGIGTAKRDVINALLAGGNKEFEDKNPLRAKIRGKDRAGVMRSLRVDRMESVVPDNSTRAPSNWESLKRNLSPGDMDAGNYSPSADPRAVKEAAVRDEKTGKIYSGAMHPFATEAYLNEKYPGQDNHLRAWNQAQGLTEGFTTNSGEFLSREEAYQRALDLKQYKTTPRDDGQLESTQFSKQQFSPSVKRDIELTGPDGKKYPATYDGIQEDGKGGGFLQITPKVDLPGATAKHSTTYAPSLMAKGYIIPDDVLAELSKDHALQRFSPSDDPGAIKSSAVQDRKTGKIYPGASHGLARMKSSKAGEDLIDGYITNNGKFLNRDDAYARAVASKQYKPTDEDYNVNKILYGLTSERFNKQNPSAAAAGTYAPPIPGKVAAKNKARYSPSVEAKVAREPDETVREQAKGYMDEAGISRAPHTGYAPLNEDLGKRVADAYEAASHNPDDPKVQASYKALADETRAQWDYLTKQGVKFEPWTKEGQPYASSAEMRADVQDNKHLWFFPTEKGFGGKEAASNNPMLQPTGITENKIPLVTNDLFRAVHDYFGHAKEGYEFGPRGEYNAYLAHSRMFSDAALPALTAETMGQNSWVNFGKHLRDEAGNIPKKGETGYVKPQDRPFAEQKATTLPDDLTKEALAGDDTKSFSPPDSTSYPSDMDGRARNLLGRAIGHANTFVESIGGKPLENKIVGSVLTRRDPKDIDVAIRVADVSPFIGKQVPNAVDNMVGGFPVDIFLTDGKRWLAATGGSNGPKFNEITPNRKLKASFKPSKDTLKYPMEMQPGKASGKLSALHAAPYEAKEAYQSDMVKAMKPLFDAFGVKPGDTTKSSYKNSAGEVEHNPMTSVKLPADKAKLFALLHGYFTDQESVAGGYSEVKPGDWQPTSPHSFSETPDYVDKIMAMGPEAQEMLAELQHSISPAVAAVNEKWKAALQDGKAALRAALEKKDWRAVAAARKALAGKAFSPAAENIKSAAVRIDKDNVVAADTHSAAFAKARKEGLVTEDDLYGPRHEDGFVTSSGRFVNRQEGYDLAKKAQQVKSTEPELTGEGTWLDASNLKSYSPATEAGLEHNADLIAYKGESVPEDTKPGTPVAIGAFSPPAMSDKVWQGLAGKKMLFIVGDQAAAGGNYTTESGKEATPLMGGPGYPHLPENQGKTGWAITKQHVSRFANAFKNVDHIAVVTGGPDMSIGSLSFAQAYLAELHDTIKSGTVKIGTVNRLAREAGRYAKKDYREASGLVTIHNFSDLEKLATTRQRGKTGHSGAQGVSFDVRRALLTYIGSIRNSKKFGTPLYTDVRDKFNDTGAFQPGQIAQIIKINRDKPIGTAEMHGVPEHPSYEFVIPGTGLGQPPQPLMLEDALKPWLTSAEVSAKGGRDRYKVQQIMPQTELNPALFGK